MTAALIATYLQDGDFTWQTTLADVLPGWRERMLEPYRNVTIAQLASHHSGFTDAAAAAWVESSGLTPEQLQTAAAAQVNATAVEGRQLFVEQAFNVTPTSSPDSFSYSNQNYIILGYIIDTLFGPWEEELEERVWRPLNMTECGYGNYPEPTPDAVEGIWPHSEGNPDPIPRSPTWEWENPRLLGPAGTARCSPLSYSRFLAMHLDGFRGLNATILDASSFAKLHEPYIIGSGRNYTAGGWMAFFSNELGTYLGHDGSNTYNYASALIIPSLDTAVFGLTNVGGPVPETSGGGKGVSAVVQRMLEGELADMPTIEQGTAIGNASGPGLGGAQTSPGTSRATKIDVGTVVGTIVMISMLLSIV
jgi:CubicO group peptidase (beta-lactamase class C family)